MFAKLALKNIKRSIKDYAIYFFTLVLGIAIFYVFNALGSQSVMLDVTERVRDMLQLMDVILGVVSVFVSFILGALIIYASRFLIKRRSKEFGIYLTLGMSKRKISLILLLETLFIGVLSLGFGLLLGVIASQLVSVIVANMFDANLTNFHFVFSIPALIKTLIYFGIIYFIVMIFNTIVISRQKLINLLSSGKRNEKIKLKNLWLCTFVFIVAAIMLGVAYYLVTDGLMSLVEESDGPEILLVPIVIGVAATFLLFWSLSGILLRIFMSFKKVYYNKLNAFILRQFSSKINTTVASMSVICLMLFVTICVLGSALSISHTLHVSIEQSLPVDIQVVSYGSDDGAPTIEEAYRREEINLNNLLKTRVSYHRYTLGDLTMNDTLSTITANLNPDNVSDATILANFDSSEHFVYQSEYNKVAPLMNLPPLDLSSNEYAIVANYANIKKYRDAALGQGQTITIDGQVLQPKFSECIDGTLSLEMMNMNSGVFIIPDNVKINREREYTHEVMLGNFVDTDDEATVEDELFKLNNRFFSSDDEPTEGEADRPIYYYYSISSRQRIIDNNVGTSALVTFVGLYIGIIFLISSAAVLALKELSESSDNRDKFTVLRKLGASNSMLNSALFWQILIFFLFPLLIAILHSIFGLMFCDFVLDTLGGIDIVNTLPGVAILLIAIYGGYFLITYFCSRSIIRERRN